MAEHDRHSGHISQNKVRRQNSSRRMFILALAFVILCGSGVLGYGIYHRSKENQSLFAGEYTVEDVNTLHEITATQDDSGEVSYTMDGKEMPDRPYFFAGHRIRYNGVEYRRNTAVKGYLIMGIDARGSLKDIKTVDDVRLADAQVLVVHNTAKDTVQLIEIPRDTMTWVYKTDMDSQIIDREINHINMAWNYGDGHELSGEYASQAVVWLMGGLPVDGYMATGMDSINLLNDLVGGVTVPIDDEDLAKADPAFIKGTEVHLEGAQAEKFVRYRNINKDFTNYLRMTHQQRYAIGFEKQLFAQQKKDKNTIPHMFEAMENNMVTNMQKGTYVKIAMDVAAQDKLLNEEDFHRVPGEYRRGEVYDEFYADYAALDQLILELFYRKV
ncbi:MAG: LCP family protein [Butyrivibrio sp.]|nr:LCP family protein [Butyrivibrio sp.]